MPTPPDPPPNPTEAREALIAQMAHLIDEVEALRPMLDVLPPAVQTGRPTPDALSMHEVYGSFATLDADVRGPRIERLLAEDSPVLAPANRADLARAAGWNDEPLPAILDAVQRERRALVERLDAIATPQWTRTARLHDTTHTLFTLVRAMVQDDIDCLRELAQRLHEADLSATDA
ncbi:hypothetical protein [Salisaeta longa]|uniref:hypothetical protein n=1 Tax=Salisaeta longa TaxID=503170 RepID=UPI0003B697BC|nr:hypothetical protein [Salisaeta longa]